MICKSSTVKITTFEDSNVVLASTEDNSCMRGTARDAIKAAAMSTADEIGHAEPVAKFRVFVQRDMDGFDVCITYGAHCGSARNKMYDVAFDLAWDELNSNVPHGERKWKW